MLRSRRESHHRNGITDLNPLQQTSATKSALLGHRRPVGESLLLALRDIFTIPVSSWEVGQMVLLAAKQQQAAVAPVSMRPL